MAAVAHPATEHELVPNQTHAEVTRDVVATLGTPGRGYMLLLAGAVGVLPGRASAPSPCSLKDGLGLAGYNPPIFWSVYITTFVFWIGIGHAGTLISAILFLFRSPLAHGGLPLHRGDDGVRGHDRRPLPDHSHRPAVDLLLAAAVSEPAVPLAQLQVAADVGRLRHLHLPHGVAPPSSCVGLIPDVAAVRDKVSGLAADGLRARCRSGWQGTDNQWRHYSRAYLYLAALATPLVLSVHSVVSWDFAMSHRPRLARDDLRALLRGRRHLLRHRHGAHADHPAPQGAQARAHDHRVSLRQPGQADAAHRLDPVLRLRDGVLHRLVQRQHLRADDVLPPRLRAAVVGRLDDDHLQRRSSPSCSGSGRSGPT